MLKYGTRGHHVLLKKRIDYHRECVKYETLSPPVSFIHAKPLLKWMQGMGDILYQSCLHFLKMYATKEGVYPKQSMKMYGTKGVPPGTQEHGLNMYATKGVPPTAYHLKFFYIFYTWMEKVCSLMLLIPCFISLLFLPAGHAGDCPSISELPCAIILLKGLAKF